MFGQTPDDGQLDPPIGDNLLHKCAGDDVDGDCGGDCGAGGSPCDGDCAG